jgi:hypothetical protein
MQNARRRPEGRRPPVVPRTDQSSSPSSSDELLFEFELLFELLLELEFELEFELELLFEFELLLLLLLEFEFELLLLLLLELEFELLLELSPSSWPVKTFFRNRSNPSSATAGAAAKDVAMNATVAAFAIVFIGGFLPDKKQPSVTA